MTLPDTVAAADTFTLPVATRAAAAAGAPQMPALLDELLHLCGEEPVTAVLAVTEALARRHSTQCVGWHALPKLAGREPLLTVPFPAPGSPRRTRCCLGRYRCVPHNARGWLDRRCLRRWREAPRRSCATREQHHSANRSRSHLPRWTQAQAVPLQTPRVRGVRPVGVTAAAAAPRPKAVSAAAPPRSQAPTGVPPLNVAAAAAGSGDVVPPVTARGSTSKPGAPAVGSPAVTRTPRSLLKSESVVSYLARTTGAATGAATSRGTPGAAVPRRSAAGPSAGFGSTSTATPRGAGADAGGADGARQRVDVDKWLLERRAREEAREKSKSSKMHKDARFIERLERQQEIRNAALAAEEDKRRHAAAAAAQWQVQQYKPLQGDSARGAATGEGTTEEVLLRKDAQRLFGHAAAVPQLVAGAKAGALLPEQPRDAAAHHGSSRLADVVLKAAAAASIASAGADGHRSLSSRLSGRMATAGGGSVRSSVSDTPRLSPGLPGHECPGQPEQRVVAGGGQAVELRVAPLAGGGARGGGAAACG